MPTKSILIVDDSISMRKMVEFTLQESGYQVETSENGQIALHKLADTQFDLILADVNMPIMDGLSFVREARKTTAYRYTPILMLTTENSNDKIQAGREAGATGWIIKPFEQAKLLSTVKKVLA